ncbi:hypothetical protein MARI_13810 [Marinobacter sp. JH2]|nr:hypothetical protein MARI_13810 [Marinobacter sp. JH2]
MSYSENNPQAGQILAKAAKRAAAALEITPQQLALILGTDERDLEISIEPESNQGFRARQFIQIFQQLQSLLGSNSAMAHWVATNNREFRSAPIDVMQTELGLDEVHAYLEFMSK